jgi:hypothetical protein
MLNAGDKRIDQCWRAKKGMMVLDVCGGQGTPIQRGGDESFACSMQTARILRPLGAPAWWMISQQKSLNWLPSVPPSPKQTYKQQTKQTNNKQLHIKNCTN